MQDNYHHLFHHYHFRQEVFVQSFLKVFLYSLLRLRCLGLHPELLLSDFKKGSSDTLSPASVEEISVPLSNILPLSFSKRIPSTISLVFSSCSIIVFSFLNNSLNVISPISENDIVWSSWSSSNNILSPMLTENL